MRGNDLGIFQNSPASARFFTSAADSVLSSQDIILLRTYGGSSYMNEKQGAATPAALSCTELE